MPLSGHADERAEPIERRYRLKVMRVLAGLVVVALLGAGCASSKSAAEAPAVRDTEPASARPTGPLGGEALGSCVEEYSPEAVLGRDFAFDGTVMTIGDGHTDRPGKGQLNYAGVTFAVNEWYLGGTGPSVTVDIAPPGTSARLAEASPTYEVGTRLLVSGASRWGGHGVEDALAWGCGFTRYYDAETAQAWSTGTR
jgi:hypothetical protein